MRKSQYRRSGSERSENNARGRFRQFITVFMVVALVTAYAVPARSFAVDDQSKLQQEVTQQDNEQNDQEAAAEKNAADKTEEPVKGDPKESDKEEQKSDFKKGAAPVKSNAAKRTANTAGDDSESAESYTLNLYGFQFGGLYKKYSSTSTSASYKKYMIGYPDMLPGNIKSKLTVNGINALKDKPFTFAETGFDLEGEGFVKTEKNTYSSYCYDVIGFVPVKDTDITGLSNTDAYNSKYVFDTEESAKAFAFISANKGVLYGEKPSDDMISALQEKGSVAMVWQRHDPAGIKYITASANPNKVSLGDSKEIALKTGFSYTQAGNYTDKPVRVTLKLDDNMSFTEGWTPSIESTAAFTVDPESVTVSEDRKELHFNITEIKTSSSSYTYLPVNVKVDISDAKQTSDKITMEAVNAWDAKSSASTTITIDRPTVSTTLDDKTNKVLNFGKKDQAVQLKVIHDNAKAGDTATHVKVVFPDLVTIKSSAANSSCKNTIENINVKQEDGKSVLEYDVTKFSVSSNKANDLIDLVLDVKEKGDKEQEKAETVCTATVGGTDAVVTQNASITVSEPYFEVIIYGLQDAWMDMSRGDGRVNSSVATVRFYGAEDQTALMKHKWTYDEEPISGQHYINQEGDTVRGPKVSNQYTNMQWRLIGFVPISYWGGEIRSPWEGESLYGNYYLTDKQECINLVEEKNGVLYGDTPTEEQAQSLAQYKQNGKAKVIAVWYVSEPSKEICKKYTYNEKDEYVTRIHPAAYTETSSGIKVEIDSPNEYAGGDDSVHPYNVIFTIPEDYDEDTINLNTEFNNAYKPIVKGFQPGDKLKYNITVIDKSGKYGYLKDSGAVGTIDYYNGDKMDYSVIGTGFEGYKIENADEKPDGHSAKSRITRRGDNSAIRHLALISEMDIAQNPTDKNVGEALYAIGYGAVWNEEEAKPEGPQDAYKLNDNEPDYVKITKELLDDYYLDYLNAAYYADEDNKDEDQTQAHFKSFEDLSADEYRSIFNSDNGTQVMETNPVLVDAMYYGMYEKSILMSNKQTGVENYNGTYYWMHDWKEKTEGNKFEEEVYNQYHENVEMQNGDAIHHLSWYQWVTGSRNGNSMQDTYFGVAFQLKLVRSETEIELPVTKELTGRKFRNGDSWNFKIEALDGGPLPFKEIEKDGKKQEVTANEVKLTPKAGAGSAKLDFGKFRFTYSDAADGSLNQEGEGTAKEKTSKIYHYKITESGDVTGVKNDEAKEFAVKVEWDSKASKLKAYLLDGSEKDNDGNITGKQIENNELDDGTLQPKEGIKFTNKYEVVELELKKTMDSYVDWGKGNNATAVFEITGMKNGKQAYHKKVGMTFDMASGKEGSILVKDIPAGLDSLVVKEVYSANSGTSQAEKTAQAGEDGNYTVSFENSPKDGTYGSGIVNKGKRVENEYRADGTRKAE